MDSFHSTILVTSFSTVVLVRVRVMTPEENGDIIRKVFLFFIDFWFALEIPFSNPGMSWSTKL